MAEYSGDKNENHDPETLSSKRVAVDPGPAYAGDPHASPEKKPRGVAFASPLVQSLHEQPAAPVDANAATSLRFGAASPGYPPLFSNQVFEDELLVGWGAAPALELCYNPLTLRVDSATLVTRGGDAASVSGSVSELARCLAPVLQPGDEARVAHRHLQPPGEAGAEATAVPHTSAVDQRASPFAPPGVRVAAYEGRLGCGGAALFQAFLASPREAIARDPGLREVFERQQRLATWFIDGASPIDLDDGRWEVLTLYASALPTGAPAAAATTTAGAAAPSAATTAATVDATVGFVTLFTFRNPFAGAKVRVCQALVLPPYQRAGHGFRLLSAAYAACALARPHVTEVTVEDPAPGFVRLRDATDLALCLRLARGDPVVRVAAPSSAGAPSGSGSGGGGIDGGAGGGGGEGSDGDAAAEVAEAAAAVVRAYDNAAAAAAAPPSGGAAMALAELVGQPLTPGAASALAGFTRLTASQLALAHAALGLRAVQRLQQATISSAAEAAAAAPEAAGAGVAAAAEAAAKALRLMVKRRLKGEHGDELAELQAAARDPAAGREAVKARLAELYEAYEARLTATIRSAEVQLVSTFCFYGG